MKRESPTGRPWGNRKCTIECLDQRRVLASIGGDLPVNPVGLQTPDQLIDSVLNGFEILGPQPATNGSPSINQFATEKDTIDALSDRLAEYWKPLLGEDVDHELVQKYTWSWASITSYTTPANDGNAIQQATDNDAHDRAISDITNSQVIGVDESDIFEISADGYLFVSRDGRLRIFDISNTVEEISSLELPPASEIYLSGDRLVSVTTGVRHEIRSEVRVYTVADRRNPELVESFEFDGTIQTSRLADGRLTLVVNHTAPLPPPRFIASDSLPTTALLLGRDPIGRFETRAEYLTRVEPLLVTNFLPDIAVFDAQGNIARSGDIGGWNDLVLQGSNIQRQQVVIVAIDVVAETPTVLDSEVVLGAHASVSYVDSDSVYIVDRPNQFPTVAQHDNIVRFSLNDGGKDLVADSIGQIRGRVRDSRMMDEHRGDLRVAANVLTRDPITFQLTASANVYVLRSVDRELRIVGELDNIADGQEVTAGYFDGDRAILTTAESILYNIDPIHGIDLSDPTNPIELSDVVIPGVSTFLQWVSPTHLVGLGYSTGAARHAQVSLYDVTDLANPTVIDTWESTWEILPNFSGWGLDGLAVHYDPASGSLLVPFAELGVRLEQSSDWWGVNAEQDFAKRGVELFSIELGENASLLHIAQVAPGDGVLRTAIVGDAIIIVSAGSIGKYGLADPSIAIDVWIPNVLGEQTRSDNANGQSGSSSSVLPQDVNSDGVISALDVLQLVNFINSHVDDLASQLSRTTEDDETESQILDVNLDGIVSPIDVLSVINAINFAADFPDEEERYSFF